MIFDPLYKIFEDLFKIFNNEYSYIFQHFYDEGGYDNMTTYLFLIPLISLLLFYFVWKYPYGTIWHWLIFISVIALFVGGFTFNSISLTLAKYKVNPDPSIKEFTNDLILKYSILNAFLSLIISIIFSLILRRFSKVQMHLPF